MMPQLLHSRYFLSAAALCAAAAVSGCAPVARDAAPVQTDTRGRSEQPARAPEQSDVVTVRRVDFSAFNDAYRFSAEMPASWQVEDVSEIQSLSLYDPAESAAGLSVRDASRIFIRFFEAGDFLTLSTVEILDRMPGELHGHDTVSYEIVKRDGVPNFPGQPSWRNLRHRLTDVRFSRQNPTPFYVVSHTPVLPRETFDAFLESIVFHNDTDSIVDPLEDARSRVTKKPFGLFVSPDISPVSPERFTGFHTGSDFETAPSEQPTEVSVRALCGGKLLQKRRADGYGGVAVQSCLFGEDPVSVVYGHLNLESIGAAIGEYLAPGEVIGNLGAGMSGETDGERKHLHLSIHKGTAIDIRGYVPSEKLLDGWLDPLYYLSIE